MKLASRLFSKLFISNNVRIFFGVSLDKTYRLNLGQADVNSTYRFTRGHVLVIRPNTLEAAKRFGNR